MALKIQPTGPYRRPPLSSPLGVRRQGEELQSRRCSASRERRLTLLLCLITIEGFTSRLQFGGQTFGDTTS